MQFSHYFDIAVKSIHFITPQECTIYLPINSTDNKSTIFNRFKIQSSDLSWPNTWLILPKLHFNKRSLYLHEAKKKPVSLFWRIAQFNYEINSFSVRASLKNILNGCRASRRDSITLLVAPGAPWGARRENVGVHAVITINVHHKSGNYKFIRLPCILKLVQGIFNSPGNSRRLTRKKNNFAWYTQCVLNKEKRVFEAWILPNVCVSSVYSKIRGDMTDMFVVG